MFNNWVRFLPLFVVQWLAEKECKRVDMAGVIFVNPFDNVFFMVEKNNNRKLESNV